MKNMKNNERMSIIYNILNFEGGYTVDHAGPTNFGITIPTYSDYKNRSVTENDIKNITKEEAIAFYDNMITKYKMDGIKNKNVVSLIFDSSINHGYYRTVKWVQEILNLKIDGILGPITTKQINNKPYTLYYSLVQKRIKFYTYLSVHNNKKYGKFLKGWMNRISSFVVKI